MRPGPGQRCYVSTDQTVHAVSEHTGQTAMRLKPLEAKSAGFCAPFQPHQTDCWAYATEALHADTIPGIRDPQAFVVSVFPKRQKMLTRPEKTWRSSTAQQSNLQRLQNERRAIPAQDCLH